MKTPEWQLLNRTYIAEIVAVDPVNGTVDVVFLDNFISKKTKLQIPSLYISVQGTLDENKKLTNAFRSSWDRHMPAENDLVLVEFGPANAPRIVGYASLPDRYQTVVADKRVNTSKYPRELVDLQPGEFDKRSSGGAYLYGDRFGNLLMAGGVSQVRINKREDEIRTESGLWETRSAGSYFRLGNPKRLLTGTAKETDFSVLDPTAPKEAFLHIQEPASGIWLVDDQWGTVRSGLGVPQLSDQGLPLRRRSRVYLPGALVDSSSVVAQETTVDTAGNTEVNFNDTTVAVDVNGGIATNFGVSGLSLDASFTTASISGSTTATVESAGAATLSGDVLVQMISETAARIQALLITLGDPTLAVSNPAVHGTVLVAQVLTPLLVGLTTLCTTMIPLEGGPITPKGAAWTALQSSIAAIVASLAIPPGTPASLLSSKVFVD